MAKTPAPMWSLPSQEHSRGANAAVSSSAALERKSTTLDTLPTELIDMIMDHIPRCEHTKPAKNFPGMMVAGETTWKNSLQDSSNSALHALCLTSRRLNAIGTPHLYRRFEDKAPESDDRGATLVGKRLLLLLRTVIRNPDRGALVKHVVGSTWHSLDTDALTESDIKAVFEQAGMITTNYPLRMASSLDTESIYLGPPPHPETEQKNVKHSPSVIQGHDIISNGKQASLHSYADTEVGVFRQHPQYDFAFCSAVSWAHAIRTGEWDAIFTLLLSYLPNMESLAIHNPDAGERCPFAQCIYLTSFMARVAISQQMLERPRETKRLQMRGTKPLFSNDAALASHGRQESLEPSARKRAHTDSAFLLPSTKRQKVEIAASIPRSLRGNSRAAVKHEWLPEYFMTNAEQSVKDIKSQQWQPLLQRFRSISLDCIYRASDVDILDVMPFLLPHSVTDFYCGYLHGASWPGDRKLNLKTITIKNGHMFARTLASFIRCCSQLQSLKFETAGGYLLPYQSLATPGVMAALETVQGTLVELDLMKVDMNYWHPAMDVNMLQGYTGYTFTSFAEFTKLKSLSLKAETMIRHSESDPEADTGPLWTRLPASLEFLQLAGNKNWFENLIPQIQGLVSLKAESREVLPSLKKIVLEVRGVEDYTATVHHVGEILEITSAMKTPKTTVLSFEKVNTVEMQKVLKELLERCTCCRP